jgi:Fe-S-cluster containining protein
MTTTTQQTDIEYITNYFQELLNKNSKSRLYCILDCAQDKILYKMLKMSNIQHYCLYKKQIHFVGERLIEELAAVAPYLVCLTPEDQFLQNLLYHGWGKNWCTFLFSDHNYENVYEHCSGNLLALTEEGETLQFRYFDPRILRVYLPSCTPEELFIFFGPVSAFCCEDETTSEPILFTIKNKELIAQFPSGISWSPPPDPFDDVEEDDDDSLFDIEETKDIPEEKAFPSAPLRELTEKNPFLEGRPLSGAEMSREEPQVNVQKAPNEPTLYETVEFESPSKTETPFELIKNAHLSFYPDKYTIEDTSIIDCDARKHLCKQKCCTLIFALSEQDVREGVVQWDPNKPYNIKRNENHYCVHLVGGQCSIYENRPAVCRRFDCRGDMRFWRDFEGMVGVE